MKAMFTVFIMTLASTFAYAMPSLDVLSVSTNAIYPSVSLRIHNDTTETVTFDANQDGLPAVTINYITDPGPSKGPMYKKYRNPKWSLLKTCNLPTGEQMDFVVKMEPFFRSVMLSASLHTSSPKRRIELETEQIVLKPMDKEYATIYDLLHKPINKVINGKYRTEGVIRLIEDNLPKQVSVVKMNMTDSFLMRQETFNDYKLVDLYTFIHEHFGGEFSYHYTSKYYIAGSNLVLIGELPKSIEGESTKHPKP